jgi:hypothetical protein
MTQTIRFSARALRVVAALLALAPAWAAACSGRLDVEFEDSGVYALDYATIVAQQPGLADCRSDELTLLERDAEVPIRIVGDRDGRLGPGARVEWVGRMLHGPQSWFDAYSTVNVYQLAAGPGAHLRLRALASSGSEARTELQRRVHLEQGNLMIRLNALEMKPGDEPDVWQWAKLTPVDAQPFSTNFDLPDLARAPRTPAQLTLVFRGMSSVPAPRSGSKAVDHQVAVSINGHALPAQSWDGRDEESRTLAVPSEWLRDKDNAIVLDVPQRDASDGNFVVDVVMFNWLEVRYPAQGEAGSAAGFEAAADGVAELAAPTAPTLYDARGSYAVAAPNGAGRWRAPVRAGAPTFAVVGGRFLRPTRLRAAAAAQLRTATPGFDYLIVAHPRLIDAIQPLARYHREHGLRVLVADVDAVYDEFNGGLAHPRAIRDYVAWGWRNWKLKPKYLLLVGDASVDIRHDMRSERLRSSDYALRPHPEREEMMLPQGLSNMPSTSYAQWAADLPNRNLIPTWQYPSAEGQAASDNGFVAFDGDFHPVIAVGRLPVVEPDEVKAIVDKTLDYMTHPAPGDWRRNVTFVATDEVATFKAASDRIAAELGDQGYGIRSLYTKQDAAEAKFANAELKKDLDSGNLLVHFLGHGGAFIWRVGPPADLFTLDDVSRLANVDRYPMVLAMTCFSAPFDNPTEDSIGERFLREAKRGAVAVFAASWSNSPNPQHSKSLISELLTPGKTIGDAIVAAKRGMDDRTFIEMYNLLGDPALVLQRPRQQLRLMRAQERWSDRVLVRVPERQFGGEITVDWVDANGATMASQRLESRDAQFALAVPPHAAEVRVYAGNLITGYDAMGALSLVAAPASAPAPVAKVAKPPARKPSADATKAAIAALTRYVADRIVASNFEADEARAKPAVAPPAIATARD